MEDAKYLDLMAKYLSGSIAADEKAELLAWAGESEANRASFDEMVRLWSVSDEYVEEEFEVDIPAAWASLDKKLELRSNAAPEQSSDNPTKQARVIRFSRFRIVAQAAAVLLLLTVGYWWMTRPDEINIVTELGQTRSIELPDGSLVELNQRSSLTYSRKFEQRQVTLEGEAFFDVERMEDSPFEIFSGDAKTTVLGTSFNVRAYPNEEEVEVTVRSGLVRLENNSIEGKKIELEKGQTGILNKNTKAVERVEVPIEYVMAWMTRELGFDQDDIREIRPVLKSVFGVDLDVADPRIWNCTVNLDKTPDPTLEDILGTLEYLLDVEVEQTSDTTVVLRMIEGIEPCK